MDDNVITLPGAGPYYASWKHEFVDSLENTYKAKVEVHDDKMKIAGQKHTYELTLDHGTSDVNIHLSMTHLHGHGGGFGIGFFLLLLLLFFGGWGFWFIGPFWFILFLVIIIGATSSTDDETLAGQLGRIARETWHKVQDNLDAAKQVPKKLEVVSQSPVMANVIQQNAATKVVGYSRLPDEVYLLSPEAARAAATPTVPESGQPKVNESVPLYCPYCGTRRQDGGNFCTNCGSALTV